MIRTERVRSTDCSHSFYPRSGLLIHWLSKVWICENIDKNWRTSITQEWTSRSSNPPGRLGSCSSRGISKRREISRSPPLRDKVSHRSYGPEGNRDGWGSRVCWIRGWRIWERRTLPTAKNLLLIKLLRTGFSGSWFSSSSRSSRWRMKL